MSEAVLISIISMAGGIVTTLIVQRVIDRSNRATQQTAQMSATESLASSAGKVSDEWQDLYSEIKSELDKVRQEAARLSLYPGRVADLERHVRELQSSQHESMATIAALTQQAAEGVKLNSQLSSQTHQLQLENGSLRERVRELEAEVKDLKKKATTGPLKPLST